MQKYRVVLEVELVGAAKSLEEAGRLAKEFVIERLHTKNFTMLKCEGAQHLATDPEGEE